MTDLLQTDLAIIGAGPAGMMAAIAAASQPARPRVVLLEQMEKPGLKLLATGGGRCNLTNTLDADSFLQRFGKKGRFMRPALAALDAPALRSFFASHGVATHSADRFHVFPVSESAASVQETLLKVLDGLGVQILKGSGGKVKGFRVRDGAVNGVVTESGVIEAPRVILATGGRSYEALGSNGSGYRLARTASHTIVEPLPALVPLITQEQWPTRCTGIVIPNARVRIDLRGCTKAGLAGDLLFTHRGISGPVVLDISGEVAALLREQAQVPLRLALANETRSEEQWLAVFEKWRHSSGTALIRKLVARTIPAALSDELCEMSGIDVYARAAHMPAAGARALANFLAETPLTITATEGFGKAMVTRGGVSLREVTPQTLESRLVKGLFFAGEILDLDGPCGGYNLQWAFSSGHLAGLSAGK